MAWELAATWRGYAWAGVHIGDLQARFWGVPLSAAGQRNARLVDFVCHRRRFSAFNFDRNSFEQYDRALRQTPPDYFYGYVSMIAELARWYTDTGRRLDRPPKSGNHHIGGAVTRRPFGNRNGLWMPRIQ